MTTRGQLLTVLFCFCYLVGTSRGLHLQISERIIGGNAADIKDFPYQLSLEMACGDKHLHICGASVISENWAVTAAHCVVGELLQILSLQIRAGTSFKDTGGEVYEIEEIIIHPEYNNTDFTGYDIALLKVSRPFQFCEVLQPIKLAETTPSEGTEVVVSGWGDLDVAGTKTEQLQEVTINILDFQVCLNIPLQRQDIKTGTLDVAEIIGMAFGMLCAGVYGGGKSPYSGDSGGPLVTENQLVGIVSRVNVINGTVFRGLHTNVAYLRDWITNLTGTI